MEQTLTIVCKLQPTTEQAAKMDALLKAFADGCNYANEQVKPGITSKTTIQSLVYQDIRAKFGLSANQAVRVCARVGANRKAAKAKGRPVRKFAPTSADYDARIFDFREKDRTVSLTLLGCREHIPVVHFGRRDIAVTSEGEKWDGKEIQQVRDRFSRVRASLQSKASKGTRSSRRRCRQLLKRLSGRERRYQQWLNHNISKQVIESAKTNNAAIAIEDLTGIRERTNQQPRDKTERRRSNSWAFYQLRLFLEYKAVKAGIDLVAVPPAYTSQTCHACNHIGLRSGKRFQCGNCGWHGDADLNGAINISKLGAVFVSQPRGSNLCCSLNCDGSGLLQNSFMLCVGESPRASAGG
jgi:IS605 OrfB family transposase